MVGKAGRLELVSSIKITLKNAHLLASPKVLKLIKGFKLDVVVSDSYYLDKRRNYYMKNHKDLNIQKETKEINALY